MLSHKILHTVELSKQSMFQEETLAEVCFRECSMPLFFRRTPRKIMMCKMSWDNTVQEHHTVLLTSLVPSTNKWKQNYMTSKGKPPELPRALWLLKVIEFMVEWGVTSQSGTGIAQRLTS